MKRPLLISTLAALLLLSAGKAQAQRSSTRGVFLNAHLSWFPSRR